MMKHSYLLLSFIFCFSFGNVQSQSTFNKDKEGVITVKTSRQFQIVYFELGDTTKKNTNVPKRLGLGLEVTYTNKESDSKKPYLIRVKVGDTISHESLGFDEPLNIAFFQEQITSELDKLTGSDHIISQSSINEIVLWVYSISKFDEDRPLSGRLILMPYALVQNHNGKDSTYKMRTRKVFNATAELRRGLYNAENASRKIDSVFLLNETNKLLIDKEFDHVSIGKKKDLLLSNAKTKKLLANPKIDAQAKQSKEDSLLRINGIDAATVKRKVDSLIASTKLKPYTQLTALKQAAYIGSIEKNSRELYSQFEEWLRPYNTTKKSVDSIYYTLRKDSIYQIKKVSLQIERGFIERVQVWIVDEFEKETIYENIYAIGFSSIKNFGRFEKTKLFIRYGSDDDSHIFLSDVFSNYDNILENYTRDFSPSDTAINGLSPENGIIELRRNEFVDLFDTKVFTDLNGIRPNSPNGLIQIAVNRRFTLKTSRQQIGTFRSDIGWLEYLNTFGSYNKVESDQRYLPLRNEEVGQNGELLSPSYATNLDFRQYENFSLGTELNTFLFDWPDGKFTAFLDIGARYGHTPVVDKKRLVVNDVVTNPDKDTLTYSAHTITWYPKLSVEVFSERRIGFVMAYQFNTTSLHSNNNFKQITSYAKSDLLSRTLERSARLSHVIEVYLRAEPTTNRNGRFFFRARYFIQQRDRNTFFSQIQLGYSYNLLFKK